MRTITTTVARQFLKITKLFLNIFSCHVVFMITICTKNTHGRNIWKSYNLIIMGVRENILSLARLKLQSVVPSCENGGIFKQKTSRDESKSFLLHWTITKPFLLFSTTQPMRPRRFVRRQKLTMIKLHLFRLMSAPKIQLFPSVNRILHLWAQNIYFQFQIYELKQQKPQLLTTWLLKTKI